MKFTESPAQSNSLEVYGRILVYIFLSIWGFKLMSLDIENGEIFNSFTHGINLVFHEAGHIFFMPFGRFLHILGGSLMQLIIPIAVMVAFLRKENNFGASVGLWWLSVSLMDLAPYINDARKLTLMLLTGGTGREVEGHDWENILGMMGLSTWDHFLGGLADTVAGFLMIVFVVWGGVLLYKQFKSLQSPIANMPS